MKKKKILTSLLGVGLLSIALASCAGKKKTSTSIQPEESNTNPITDTTPEVISTSQTEEKTIVLTHVDAKEATCDTDGNIEYWYDALNNKYYSDKDGKNEITGASTIIKKGHQYSVNPMGNVQVIYCERLDDVIISYAEANIIDYYRIIVEKEPTIDAVGKLVLQKCNRISDKEYQNIKDESSITEIELPMLSDGDAYLINRLTKTVQPYLQLFMASVPSVITDAAEKYSFAYAISEALNFKCDDIDALVNASTYTIHFYDNGEMTDFITIKGSEGFTPTADLLTKQYYVLKGFSSDGESIDYELNKTYIVSETLHLIAVWEQTEYKLSFDFNGYNASANPIYTNNKELYVPNLSSIVSGNEDKIFKGWSLNSDGSGKLYQTGDSLTLDKDTTLYAVWEDRYKVTYNMNGYGNETPNQTIEQSASTGNIVSLKASNSLPVTAPEGKAAIGYSLDPNATSATYSFNQNIKLTENLTLYVVWKDLVSVTFDYNGAAYTNYTTYANVNRVVTTPEAPTRSGYEFLGWSTNKHASSGEAANKSVVVPGTSLAVTYYALWSDHFILSYDLNNTNTSATINPISADSDGKVKLATWSSNLTNYIFLGWDFDKDATTPTYSSGETITIDSNKTIYAIWEATASINFYPNGGSGSVRKVQYQKLGAEVTLACFFTKDNYVFKGWGTSASSTTPLYSADQGKLTITENELGKITNLYAIWEGKEITLAFINTNTSIEDILDTTNIKYGKTIEIPDESYFDLESGNYELLGWSATEYSFGDPIPTIVFEGGETLKVDDLTEYENNGLIALYAVIVESGYTYSKNIVEATFEENGYIEYICNEDSSKSYTQTISKETLFYSYIDEVFTIADRGTVITTTISQGELNIGDKITIILKDGTVRNNVVVKSIEMYKKVIQTAKAGDSVGILIDIDKNDLSVGGLICENGKEIHTNTVYVKAYVLTKDEGGRQTPFFINYKPNLNIGGINHACVVTGIYDVITGEDVEMAMPGNSYMLKIEVPQNAAYSFYTWVGKQELITEGGRTVVRCDVVGRTELQYDEYMQYCDLRVDLQDGSTVKTYRVAKDLKLGQLDIPQREGYTFMGWCDDDTYYYDVEIYELMNDESVSYYSRYNRTIYAQWIKNDIVAASSGIIDGRGVTATTNVLNTTINLTDKVKIYTGTEFIDSVITGIIVGGSYLESATAGTENVTVLLRGLNNTLPVGSVIQKIS